MLKQSLLLAALAGVVLTTTSALAFAPKDATAATAPRPIQSSVVNPTGLPRNFAGEVINVEFSLDAAGAPRDIQVLHVSDPVLKRQLVAAFRQWRFETAAGNATPATKRFILPIELHADEA